MKNTTARKIWETPKVFVLGAEGTQAQQAGGKAEKTGQKTLYTHTASSKATNPQVINTFSGYKS